MVSVPSAVTAAVPSAGVTTNVTAAVSTNVTGAVSAGVSCGTTYAPGAGVPYEPRAMAADMAWGTGVTQRTVVVSPRPMITDGVRRRMTSTVMPRVMERAVVAADEVMVVIEEEGAREGSKPIVGVVVVGVVVRRIDRIPVDRSRVVGTDSSVWQFAIRSTRLSMSSRLNPALRIFVSSAEERGRQIWFFSTNRRIVASLTWAWLIAMRSSTVVSWVA